MAHSPRPIWIDLDNTPHVPFFRPIIDELESKGFRVLVTARDAYNVTDLVRLHQMRCTTIGRHYGKNKAMKVLGLVARAVQLLPFIAKHRPQFAVSHGSRAQMLAAKLMRVRSMVIADYEHVTHLTRPDYLVLPELIPTDVGSKLADRVLKYPGIKEDVYAPQFVPDSTIIRNLGLSESDIVVTFRPPASEAHYHSTRSDELSFAALHLLAEHKLTKIVMLPRNDHQMAEISRQFPQMLQSGKMIIPGEAVDGLNLVWHSDLVISGGGTMNREAAALGVPVYSTFRGPIGAVDRYLASTGRLILLESTSDVQREVKLSKRFRTGVRSSANTAALDTIVKHIVAATERGDMRAPVLNGGEEMPADSGVAATHAQPPLAGERER